MTSFLYQRLEKEAKRAREVVGLAFNPPADTESVQYKRFLNVSVDFGVTKTTVTEGVSEKEDIFCQALNTRIANFLQDKIGEIAELSAFSMEVSARDMALAAEKQLEDELARVRAIREAIENGPQV